MDEVKDRICNALILLGLAALVVGAGYREYLIHNGRLTTDLNADGHSITNLPDGFFPPSGVTSVNGRTGDVVVAEADLTPATNYTDFAIGSFASTGTVKKARSANSAVNADMATEAEVATFAYNMYAPDWTSWTVPSLLKASTNAAVAVVEPHVSDMANPHNVTAEQIGAAPAAITNEMAEMCTESSLVYRLYQGSNVVVEVTNYNSQVNAPELKIMQLNESDEYITVWAETNGLARTLASARRYTDDATGAVVQAVAPRAWSKVTAGMGVDAPSNTTWISTARTVIAGGLEPEKHVTSGGAIWILTSNGMTADFHPQTNNTAFIDLSNADGTPVFRVEKTDSFLVGVHVDDVTVDGNALVCRVGVVASEHPLVRVRASLTSGDWAKEEDGIPASLATVTWSGTAGNWTCRIQNNTGGSQLFAQMEYFQEGGTKVVNSAALDVSAGILCTDGIHKVRPVYNSGTITWEVVQ